MNNDEVMIIEKTKQITNELSGFEKYLSDFGLPIDNVLASPDERRRLLMALPDFLESLPKGVKADSRYLSKFIAGGAIGLFDASLNFVWNEVVINIRSKVISYGLDYFYDAAVGGTLRDSYKDESDLPSIKDQVLLDTCFKLGIISGTLYKKLCHMLDMRNNVGASHPNEYSINAYELLGWLQTCVQEVITDDATESALFVKQVIDNIKRSEVFLDQAYLSLFESKLKDLSTERISILLSTMFGLFVSHENMGNTVLLQNLLTFGMITWKYATDKSKYDLGAKIDSYRGNLDDYKTSQAELFFGKCDGKRFYSVDAKTISLTLLLEQLENAHYGWDNYTNEVPFARDIMTYIQSIDDIPPKRIENIIRVFTICRLGNNHYYYEGVSPIAKRYYDRFFSLFDEKATIVFLNTLMLTNVQNMLTGPYRQKHALEIIDIISKNELLSDRVIEALRFIRNYKGVQLGDVFLTKEYNDIVKAIL